MNKKILIRILSILIVATGLVYYFKASKNDTLSEATNPNSIKNKNTEINNSFGEIILRGQFSEGYQNSGNPEFIVNKIDASKLPREKNDNRSLEFVFTNPDLALNLLSEKTGEFAIKIKNYRVSTDKTKGYDSAELVGLIQINGQTVEEFKIGDKIGNFTVISKTRNFINLSGEAIIIKGRFLKEGSLYTIGSGFEINDSDVSKLPHPKDEQGTSFFLQFKNSDLANKLLSQTNGEVSIKINNFSLFMGEVEGYNSAELIELVK